MQRKLLESGNIFKRSDGRWNGVVWYSDEQSSKKRKSSAGPANKRSDKITAYLADFDRQLTASDESKAKFEEAWASGSGYSNFPLWSAAPTTGWSAPPSIRSTDPRRQGGG